MRLPIRDGTLKQDVYLFVLPLLVTAYLAVAYEPLHYGIAAFSACVWIAYFLYRLNRRRWITLRAFSLHRLP